MEKDVGEVVATGAAAEELNVQRVRHPGQRMPVSGVKVLEGPFCRVVVYTAVNVRVVDHVHMVVGVNEGVLSHRPVQSQRDRSQQETDYVRASDFRHGSMIGT